MDSMKYFVFAAFVLMIFGMGIVNASLAFEQGVCKQTVMESIILTEDITCVKENLGQFDAGLDVGADNIVIDCQGHTLTGPGGFSDYYPRGINNNGHNNVTIKNCTIADFYTSIMFSGASNSTIENNNLSYSTNYGLYFKSSSNNNTIANNLISYNGNNALIFTGCSENLLINNTVNYNSQIAFSFTESSNNNTFIGNTANSNYMYGFLLRDSTNNILINNIANSNEYEGIVIWDSSNTTLDNNTANSNLARGIYITGVSDSTINNLYACGNVVGDLYDSNVPNSNWTNSTYSTSSTPSGCGAEDEDCREYFDQIAECEEAPECTIPSDGMLIDESVILCSGTYNLENGITINANDVTVTCDETVLNGTGSNNGIYLGSKQRVTVTGCTVQNYNHGIYLSTSSFNTLTNNTVSNNYNGILLTGGTVNNLINNTVTLNNNHGIYLASSSFNTLTNNTVSNNTETGIRIESSGTCTLDNNIVTDNNDGIKLMASINNNLNNNTVCSNTLDLNGTWSSYPNNDWSNSTYDTSDPDNHIYFDRISWCNGTEFTYTPINVTLTGPANGALITEDSTTLNYTVNIEANCTVYHNITGWRADCETNGTTGASCGVNSMEDGVYEWNVYCVDANDEINSAWAEETNRTFTVNTGFIQGVCEQTITKDATLTENLDCRDEKGIIIGADNLVIDCDNYNLTGDGTYLGIEINGYNNITVQNCNIYTFATGISLAHTVNNTIQNNYMEDNGFAPTTGINLYNANYTDILDNIIVSDRGDGVHLEESFYNNLERNNASTNARHGFYIELSDNNTLTDNIAVSNGKYGFYVELSYYNILTGNYAGYNGYDGLYLSGSDNNTLIENVVENNYFNGLFLDGSSYNILTGNEVSGHPLGEPSGYFGLGLLDNSNFNTLEDNLMTNNFIGLYLFGVHNNTFINTTTTNNTYGTQQFIDADNTFIDTYACGNDVYDILEDDLNNTWIRTIYSISDANATYLDQIATCPIVQGVCGQIIGINTVLTEDIICEDGDLGEGEAALSIVADSITIDCNGYALVGYEGIGIGIEGVGYDGITLVNCNITNFLTGVYIEDSIGTEIYDNHVHYNGMWRPDDTGIHFYNVNYSSIYNNFVYENDIGIVLEDSNENEIYGNEIYENLGSGIEFYNSIHNEVYENEIYFNMYGMYFENTNNTLMYDNLVCLNDLIDILFREDAEGNEGENICNVLNDIAESNAEVSCPTGCPYYGTCGAEIGNSIIFGKDMENCENGLLITASDVVIDCNGYGIYGDNTSGGFGIVVDSVDNVTIHNCTIKYFGEGIALFGSNGSTITNNHLDSNGVGSIGTGILMIESNYTTVQNNLIENDLGNGIYVLLGNLNTIANNELINNYYGMLVEGSNNNSIEDNICNENLEGIVLSDSSNYNTLLRNTVNRNELFGIYLTGPSMHNYLIENTVSQNYGGPSYGILIDTGADNNTLTNNTVIQNDVGISIDSADNTLTDNFACSNTNFDVTDSLNESTWTRTTYTLSDPINTTYFDQLDTCPFLQGVCGQTITESITLTEDMDCSWTNIDGIKVIGAGDLVIDCDGHKLIGDGGEEGNVGIYILEQNNIEILNCEIEGFFYGIEIDTGDNVSVEDSNIHDNTCEGLYIYESNTTVKNTIFQDNLDLCARTGLYLSASTLHLFNSHFINNDEYGLYEEFRVELDTVYWTIEDYASCIDNNMQFSTEDGYITFDGGILHLDNCVLEIYNQETETWANWTITGNMTDYVPPKEMEENDTATFEFDNSDTQIDLNLNDTVNASVFVGLLDDEDVGSLGIGPIGMLPFKGIQVELNEDANNTLNWAIIRIYYTDAELDALGIEESSLRMYYFNETSGEWELVEEQGIVTTPPKYVWGNVTHFSTYALFGEEAEEADDDDDDDDDDDPVRRGGSGGGAVAVGSRPPADEEDEDDTTEQDVIDDIIPEIIPPVQPYKCYEMTWNYEYNNLINQPVTITVLANDQPAENVLIDIVSPLNKIISLTTDATGRATFTPDYEGIYKAQIRSCDTKGSINVLTSMPSVKPPTTEPDPGSTIVEPEQQTDWLCIGAIIVIVLIIGVAVLGGAGGLAALGATGKTPIGSSPDKSLPKKRK